MNTARIITAGLLLVGTAFAQQPARPVANLSGVWLRAEPRNAVHPQSQWSNETLPLTARGRAALEANKPGKGPRPALPEEDNDPIRESNPPGLYRTLVYNRPFEFVQTQEKVIQLFGWTKVWRAIYTDGRPVPEDIPAGPYWYGYSVGRWEGSTLVVTTMGLDDRAWFDEWGLPISQDARVEERWQRVAQDRIQLRITVTDPVMYEKPWTSSLVHYVLQKGVEPEEIILAPIDEKAFNERLRTPAVTKPK